MADAALWVGALAAALAAAVALVSARPKTRVAAMALALVLAVVLLGADRWDDERIRELRASPELLIAVAVTAAAATAGLAVLIRRRPAALALLAVAALPFRVPIEAGGDSANLLLPLYVVIAAGVLAQVWRGLAAPGSDAVAGRSSPPPSWPARALPWALAGFVALYAVQSAYSDDLSKAIENLCFFLVPFTVLAALLARVAWSPRLLAQALAILLAEALVFCAIGFAEYATGELLWNPTILDANELHAYFRVNSLFWDPNILGRYLMLAIVAVAAAMLWERAVGRVALAAGIAFVLLAGLAITFSQSSLIALLAGLATLAALRWSVRWTAAALVGLAISGFALAVATGDVDLSERSLEARSTGRAELVSGGLELAGEAPVLGHGSASFETEFAERNSSPDRRAAVASHTEPVTVLAEQGALGLIAYGAVVAIALAALAGGIGRFAPGVRPGLSAPATQAGRIVGAARVALLAALVAMIVHSLGYAAFFIDPITWTLLAIGLGLAVRDPGEAAEG